MDSREIHLLEQTAWALVALLRQQTLRHKRLPKAELQELEKAERKLSEALIAPVQKPMTATGPDFTRGGGLVGATARALATDYEKSQKYSMTVSSSKVEYSDKSPIAKKPRQDDLIMTALAMFPEGLTCDQLERQTGIRSNTIGSRMGPLVDKHLVEATDEQRKTKSGRWAKVWVLL